MKRFKTVGDINPGFLTRYAFQPIDDLPTIPESVGFVCPSDPDLFDRFIFEYAGGVRHLCARIDTRKISASVVRKKLRQAEAKFLQESLPPRLR